MRVAVNISPRQFQHRQLLKTILNALSQTALDPQFLNLEITEGVLLQNADATSVMLQELSGLGLQLSVDDFGTGYSSLSYLKHLPIDRLKIDQSFVRDVPRDPDDAAIITMPHSLGIEAVAEGVETDEQMSFLLGRGCDIAQGYASPAGSARCVRAVHKRRRPAPRTLTLARFFRQSISAKLSAHGTSAVRVFLRSQGANIEVRHHRYNFCREHAPGVRCGLDNYRLRRYA